LQDGGVVGRLVLKGILKNWVERTWTKLIVNGNQERYVNDSEFYFIVFNEQICYTEITYL
jgi:hypothetical protein